MGVNMDDLKQLFANPVFVGAAAAIGSAASIVAIYLAWRANAFAKNVAAAQKVFEPGRSELSLFGHRDINVILIAAPLTKETVLTTLLDISVENTGNVALEQAQVLVRANKTLFYGDALDKSQFPHTDPFGESRVMDEDHHRTLIFNIQQPFYSNLTINFKIPLTITADTLVTEQVGARTSDKKSIKYHCSLRFLWVIDVVLLSLAEQPRKMQIGLYIVDTLLEPPLKVIGTITSKHVARINKAEKIHAFLFAEIQKERIKKEAGCMYSTKIDAKDIKIGFLDEHGGQIPEMEFAKNLRRRPEIADWAKSHGYEIKRKNGFK
jgi:hypothetical protein